MAKICECCGKKNNSFIGDPYNLDAERILCYKCAEPISSRMGNLYYVSTKGSFDKIKSEILDICHEKYNEDITKCIIQKIEERYKQNEAKFKEHEAEELATTLKNELIENHMLTTGYNFDGFLIENYIGIVSGQVVLGTGFLSEFTASFADFFGEESYKFADKLEQAKNAAMKKLIDKSIEKGGNALIGVDFDYITFRNNMIGVVANGTSVRIKKEE